MNTSLKKYLSEDLSPDQWDELESEIQALYEKHMNGFFNDATALIEERTQSALYGKGFRMNMTKVTSNQRKEIYAQITKYLDDIA